MLIFSNMFSQLPKRLFSDVDALRLRDACDVSMWRVSRFGWPLSPNQFYRSGLSADAVWEPQKIQKGIWCPPGKKSESGEFQLSGEK